jgi:hypothetical protein
LTKTLKSTSIQAYIMNGNNFDFSKLLTSDYWLSGLKTPSIPVENKSLFFWLHIALISIVIFSTVVLSGIKGLFLDKETAKIMENPQNAYMIKNPIYNAISYYQTYFTIAYCLLLLGFTCRQLNIYLFNTRIFFGLCLAYISFGVIQGLIYFFNKRKLDIQYYKMIVEKQNR